MSDTCRKKAIRPPGKVLVTLWEFDEKIAGRKFPRFSTELTHLFQRLLTLWMTRIATESEPRRQGVMRAYAVISADLNHVHKQG